MQLKKIISMELTDFALPILGFALIFNAVYFKIKTNKFDKKHKWDIAIGIVICGFSIWSSVNNSQYAETLQSSVDKLIEKRDNDSIGNSHFYKYLKDTFGIEKVGNEAKIVNRNTFIKNVTINNSYSPVTLPDNSQNYFYKFSGDSLLIYPKSGTWIRPFLSFDYEWYNKNGDISQEDGMINTIPKQINVRDKKYNIVSYIMSYPRSKDHPLIINIKGAKGQSIIFGDYVDAEKRYLYENGKVYWIPNVIVTN
jgi:hypothetical protein